MRASAKPAVFLLHFLGGSAKSWDAVVGRLGSAVIRQPIDLAGFGANADLGAASPETMADHVAGVIRDAAPTRWLLVGHSMGAKVATLVARRAEDGDAGLEGLDGLVLVAGSPPAPEPMGEAQRQRMLGWFAGNAVTNREEATNYITQNVGGRLDDADLGRAVDDVLRMDREAWRAWLEHGSREDCSSRVGRLATPAVIVAGSEDEDLGTDAQVRLMAPHFETVRTVTLEGAGHLLPLERPDDIADLILSLVGGDAAADAIADPAYRALIRSDRVSARTRAVLLDRARPDDPDRTPEALSPTLFAVLRAALDRIVPQRTTPPIDLAARIDRALAHGDGDGWRFADLPADAQACAAGLATLDAAARRDRGASFADLDAGRRDALLRRIEAGSIEGNVGSGHLSSAEMKLWFEDLRAMAVRLYVSHPATLARMGYSGIANGGDGERKQGFVETKADRPEPWEPRGMTSVRG